MTETDTLAAALLALQSDLPRVGKNRTARIPGKNGGAGYSYKYADLVDVTAQVLPALNRLGLAFVCYPRITANGKHELAGALIHAATGERIEGALPLTGGTEQAMGSSITYARRYLLGCLTGVVTDEDDDGAGATHSHRTADEVAQAAEATRMADEVDTILVGLRDATTAEEVRGWGSRAHSAGVLAHPCTQPVEGCRSVNDAVAKRLQQVEAAAA